MEIHAQTCLKHELLISALLPFLCCAELSCVVLPMQILHIISR